MACHTSPLDKVKKRERKKMPLVTHFGLTPFIKCRDGMGQRMGNGNLVDWNDHNFFLSNLFLDSRVATLRSVMISE